MVIRARENLIGAYAFLIGIILAIIVGFIFVNDFVNPIIMLILAVLGIVAGFFVAEKDVQTFLLASVSIVIVGYYGISGLALAATFGGVSIGKMASSFLQSLIALFVPSTIVVAIKTVFSISRV